MRGQSTMTMLNLRLRPLLTEWHPRLQYWECKNPNENEINWPGRHEFQDALDGARQELRQYASLFAEVAEVPELVLGTDATDSMT